MVTDGSLNSLKVLVTRPEQQARQLCRLIAAAGGQPFAFPVITIKPIPAQNWNRIPLIEYDMIIFVSQYAALYFVAGLHQPLATSARLIAVGPATANAMYGAGLSVDIMPLGVAGSESLLTMPEFNNIGGKKIAIVRGQGGRELLAYQLIQRGAKINYIEVYQRHMTTPANADIAQAKMADCVIITSGSGLDNLCVLTNYANLKRKWLIVVSERIKQYAVKLGFSKILVSYDASDTAVMQQINILGNINGKR